jgi:hypothetical protein
MAPKGGAHGNNGEARQALQEWPEPSRAHPREFELPGEDAIIRKEGDKLLLDRLEPLEEDFPEIEALPPARSILA